MSASSNPEVSESSFIAEVTALVRDDLPGLPRLAVAAGMVRDGPHAFVRWLDGLTRDGPIVRTIAARSYWHPNGFAKLVLHISAQPDFKIRMHVWPESGTAKRGESNPHSHRWEFASTLLTGRGMLVTEYQEAAEGGKPYTRYHYGTNPAEPAALVANGAVRLGEVKWPRLTRGDVYSCDTEVVHTAEPLGADLTATAVVQGPRRTPATAVYCAPGESDDQPNRPLSVSELRLLVKAIVAGVGGCSSRR